MTCVNQPTLIFEEDLHQAVILSSRLHFTNQIVMVGWVTVGQGNPSKSVRNVSDASRWVGHRTAPSAGLVRSR